jgi:hypothetical protein
MKVYMFQRVPLSIIRSLFTVHSAMVYVTQVVDSFRKLSTNLYDVAKNDTMKAFRCLVDFVKNSSYTNVIFSSVANRHDLMSSSCVNEEVRALNRKLMKIRKIFGHVSILEINPNREYYTKHGHHLNGLGKAEVSKQLPLQLLSVLQWKRDVRISLSWIKDHTNNMHDETQKLVKNPPATTTTEQNNSTQNLEEKPPVTTITEQNNYPPRTSNRLQKTPATLNEDFFGGDNRLPETSALGTSIIHSGGQTPNQFLKLFHQNIRGLRGKPVNSYVIYIKTCHIYCAFQNITWINLNLILFI